MNIPLRGLVTNFVQTCIGHDLGWVKDGSWYWVNLPIYCDVPGSPCLSKMSPVYGRCQEPGFVGDPTPPARDNIIGQNLVIPPTIMLVPSPVVNVMFLITVITISSMSLGIEVKIYDVPMKFASKLNHGGQCTCVIHLCNTVNQW